MNKKIPPGWSEQEQLKGQRMHQAWERFFSDRQQTEKDAVRSVFDDAADQTISAARVKHEATLLSYPNVVGVAEGVRTRRGKPTGEPCLVVFVSRKFPKLKLRPAERLPREIDGFPVDVVEVGEVEPLPK